LIKRINNNKNKRERKIMTKKKILCVDDEENQRFIISEILTEVGEYEVIIASNGEEGLKLYLEHKPDIVITDIDMPKMNGIKLAEELRKEGMDTYLPIIMVSGGDIINEREKKFKELRIDVVIKKPFDVETLINAVKKVDLLNSTRHE
jgi:two-component system, OmpR family, response regulator TrcR